MRVRRGEMAFPQKRAPNRGRATTRLGSATMGGGHLNGPPVPPRRHGGEDVDLGDGGVEALAVVGHLLWTLLRADQLQARQVGLQAGGEVLEELVLALLHLGLRAWAENG